ncbi:MAG: hypothetical protein IPM69_16465 [Ignavibacteria bacterium]|nr:hypothetical protein [Ignavibacteria bacterium]
MGINPESHHSSEWIHVKILEAKLNSKGNPQYFQTHSILGLDFGEGETPQNIHNIDLIAVRANLYEQLGERMSFVEPKDPIVAQLIFDLGNINAMTIDVKSALQVYEIAEKYGFSSELLDKRRKHFEALQWQAEFMNTTVGWAKANPIVAFLLLLVSSVAFILWLIFVVQKYRSKKAGK